MTSKLRQLHEAATPGPWYLLESPWLQRGLETMVLSGSPDPHVATAVCDFECQADGDNERESNGWNDAELIAYLRNHAADFIALIDAAGAAYKIAERDTDEFNALRDALKPVKD